MAFAGIVSGMGQAARNALPIIRSGINQGLGADNLFQRLRTRFPGLRRHEVRTIARAQRVIQAAAADLRFVNRNLRPDPSRLSPALTTLRRQFSFRVRVRGVDITTGEIRDSFVTITTDKVLTRGEIEDTADRFISQEPDRYGLGFSEVQLLEGVRAGPAGTL